MRGLNRRQRARDAHGGAGTIVALVLLVVTVALGAPLTAAASAGPAPAGAVPAALATAVSPEQQLADKYAPIMELKQQTGPCDDKGEPYLPAPVQVVLGDPQVVLRENEGGSNASTDPIIKRGPTAADLADKGSNYYLDLPGDPRDPGCTYEHLSTERMVGRQPTIYAHIVVDPEGHQLALQYWFYYVFNRFNNLHESDWEMIQLRFDAASPQEALQEAEPDEIAYAQHEGGELAHWDDAKFHHDGTHPIVYPAAGSHASYYGSDVYLGWGEHGSGLGCDDSSGPSFRVVPQVVLLPDKPTASGPFAWLTFDGRWGEKDRFPFDGPTGPNAKAQWTDPFSWEDGLRKSSLGLGQTHSFGPDPTGLFCKGVAFGPNIFIQQKNHAWYSYSAVALLILVPLAFFLITRRLLGEAVALFARRARTFLAIGAVLVVVGGAATYVDDALNAIPAVGDVANALLSLVTPTQTLFFDGTPGLASFIGWTLVTPAVIAVVAAAQAGQRIGGREAYDIAVAHFWPTVKAAARAAVILLLLLVSIVGIPWAAVKLVRWSLLPEAVVLEGTTWARAARTSERSVVGRWWRTAVVLIVVGFLLAAVAPVVGILVLIFIVPSVFWANVASGVVYALTFPFAGIISALWYLQRRPQPIAAADEAAATRRPFWRFWRARPRPTLAPGTGAAAPGSVGE